MENNFVYFLHDGDIEMGESYAKHLFIIDESGQFNRWSAIDGYFST